MQHRLIITIDDDLYSRLRAQAGPYAISDNITNILREHFATTANAEAGYRALAADEADAREATEWAEGLLADSMDERECANPPCHQHRY